jgi:hypothetical protein
VSADYWVKLRELQSEIELLGEVRCYLNSSMPVLRPLQIEVLLRNLPTFEAQLLAMKAVNADKLGLRHVVPHPEPVSEGPSMKAWTKLLYKEISNHNQGQR